MANKDMFLWWGSGSGPCWRVLFIMEEKGLWKDCPNKLIEFSKKEHKTEEVLKLNPRGQVPTFKDGDLVVNESNAICLYLEEKYASHGNRLLPENVDQRALVYQRMFESSNFETAARPLFMYRMKTKKEEWDQDHLKELIGKAEEELARWDSYLKGKKYLCGDDFTMADAFLYISTAILLRQGGKLDKYPALKAFNELVAKRDAAVKTVPPHWKDTPSPNTMEGVGA